MTETTLLIEHCRGDSVRAIAARHGMSKSAAHRIIVEDGNQRIANLERTLLLAELMEANGREATWPGIVIPVQAQGDRADAISLFSYCLKRLRQRGWDLEVTTRYVPMYGDAGEEIGKAVVFLLTPPGGDQ